MEERNEKPSSRGKLIIGSLAALLLAFVAYSFVSKDSNGQTARQQQPARKLTLEDIPFDGQASLAWIEKMCAIGPRVSGTDGMTLQQKMLKEHFESLGGKVEMQKFGYRHPNTGRKTQLANLIVRWHPARTERILLCAHYDTRPYPDQDRRNPRGVFVGANDGGSGVAVLCEMGRHMPKFAGEVGVDFVLLDGEEFIFDADRDRYFLGSEWFGREYAADKKRNYGYRAAVLLDMVGDASLDLYQERNGLRWRDSRWIVQTIWKKAAELGVGEFIAKPYDKEILDDHIMLHQHGKIPACDIIDFSYGSRPGRNDYWHTTQDTPDKCSALSLAKVGWVVHEWLKDQSKK